MTFESPGQMLSLDAAFWVLEPLRLVLFFPMVVVEMIVSYDILQMIVMNMIITNNGLVMVVMVMIFISDQSTVVVMMVDIFNYRCRVVVLIIAVFLAFWFISMAEMSSSARNHFGLLTTVLAVVVVVLS